MKSLLMTLVLLISISSMAADLKVTIDNIRNEKGVIRVSVFADNGAFYKDNDHAVANLTLPVSQAHSFVVPRLNPGKYALAVIHDENENKQLDTGLFGIPKEGYCFSNSNSIMPPSFKKASFDVTAPETSVSLKMRYL